MPPTITPRWAAALTLAAVQPLHALPIDSFDGVYTTNTVYFSSGPPLQSLATRTASASVPGGSRRTDLVVDPALTGTSSASLNGSGDLWAFAGGGQRLNFSFSYGTESPMNLDLSGNGMLRLAVYYSTPVTLTVQATTETTAGGDPDGSAFSLTAPDLFRQTLDIPLGSFTPYGKTGRPVNWADVDGLSFTISALGPIGPAGDGFWIQNLSAEPLPEPPAVLLMASALALLAGLRRRRPR